MLGVAAACHSCWGAAKAEAREPKAIEQLIEQLASPNKPPLISDFGDVSYPPSYDKKAQDRVSAAFKRLFELGKPTFPCLLKHLDDTRYSLTKEDEIEGDWHNYHVGRLCRAIFLSHLQPYGDYYARGKGDPRDHPRRPSYFKHYQLSNPAAAEKWWKARKNKTMVELQIEALEWVIAEEAKRPKDYSDSEREHLVRVLHDVRASGHRIEARWPFGK